MKRFKITNNKNGLKFQLEAESLTMQPEYGLPERWVQDIYLSEEEKASALESRTSVGSVGEEIVEYKLPAEHTIEEKDITAELKAEAAAKIVKDERLKALRDKHAAMKPNNLDTIVELRQAILELQEILGVK